MWLDANVIFNLKNKFFVVDSDGKVSTLDIYTADTSNSLLLLDPCDYIQNGQYIGGRMLLIFSSPSDLAGQPGRGMSQLDKASTFYVMQAPTVTAVRRIHKDIDETVLSYFSWNNNGTAYCPLRWLNFSRKDIVKELLASLKHVSREDLWEWFTTTTDRVSNDPRLPFRLCIVEACQRNEWTVTGFHSALSLIHI